MDECVFCKIVSKELPAEIIYEDSECIVVPDKFPASEGQTLVISKNHVPYILEMDDELYIKLFTVAKKISKALDKTFKPERTCIVVEGFHVPHVHIKLYPVKDKNLILTGKVPAEDFQLKEIAQRIRENL